MQQFSLWRCTHRRRGRYRYRYRQNKGFSTPIPIPTPTPKTPSRSYLELLEWMSPRLRLDARSVHNEHIRLVTMDCHAIGSSGGDMGLRMRFLLVLALFGLSLILVAFLLTRYFLKEAALQVDQRQAHELLLRGKNVLAEEASALRGAVDDWATWDDTYQYMEQRDPRYLESNYVPGKFTTLKIAFVACYRRDLSIVIEQALDVERDKLVPFSAEIRQLVAQIDLRRVVNTGVPIDGYLLQGDQLWLVAAAPIRTSLGEGPGRGVLLMGRRMDDDCLGRLRRVIDPSLLILEPAPGWPMNKPVFDRFSPKAMLARESMPNLLGKGNLIFQLTVPRVAFMQNTTGLYYLSAWIILFCVCIWLLSLLLLNRWVLCSITESVQALRAGVATAGYRTDGARHLPIISHHDDEMKSLFDAVNAAIEAVESSAREVSKRREEATHAQRLAALGTLSAGVAHEINNPNSVIKLNQSVLKKQIERFAATYRVYTAGRVSVQEMADGAEQERELKLIVDETLAASDRIAEIVKSLKHFSSPVLEGESDRVQIAALIQEAVHWLQHDLQASGCRVEVCCEHGDYCVKGKHVQLLQVFVNLLQNALHAITGAGLVRVCIACLPEQKRVQVQVVDEGCGMRPDEVEHALDPFFTTRRSSGGVGLGLSISAAILKAHGGSLKIASQPGSGCTVTVLFPIDEGG